MRKVKNDAKTVREDRNLPGRSGRTAPTWRAKNNLLRQGEGGRLRGEVISSLEKDKSHQGEPRKGLCLRRKERTSGRRCFWGEKAFWPGPWTRHAKKGFGLGSGTDKEKQRVWEGTAQEEVIRRKGRRAWSWSPRRGWRTGGNKSLREGFLRKIEEGREETLCT